MPPVTVVPTLPLIEIVVAEPLNAEAAPRVGRLLDEAVALRPGRLVVDLTACEFVDAAGIGLLLDVHRRTRAAGGRLTLQGLSPRLRRILKIARVDHVLHGASAPDGYQPRHRAAGTSRHPLTTPPPAVRIAGSRDRPEGTDA